jgi:hypothetical protein
MEEEVLEPFHQLIEYRSSCNQAEIQFAYVPIKVAEVEECWSMRRLSRPRTQIVPAQSI